MKKKKIILMTRTGLLDKLIVDCSNYSCEGSLQLDYSVVVYHVYDIVNNIC